MLLLGIIGVAVSIAGVYYGNQLVDDSFSGLDNSLALTSQSLGTAVESLELAKATIGDVNNGLDTVETAAVNIARTITDTRPLLDQVGVVVSEDAPASIEAMQAAIPAVAEVAGAIDQTLVTLNGFAIDETILGTQIHYDLGIDYDPDVAFDEAFVALGDSVEGLPENLRSVRGNLEVTSENLATISDSIVGISADLDTINGRVAEVPALIDQYIDIANQLNGSLGQVRTQVLQQQQLVKRVLTFILIWWGLPQLALVMIGWDFLFGRRGATAAEIKEDVLEDIQDDIEEMKDEVEGQGGIAGAT
jgi:methyl-accepting chemotaxis protein